MMEVPISTMNDDKCSFIFQNSQEIFTSEAKEIFL